MSLRLLVVRHGETTANAAGILDTRLPGHPLSGQGHQQAALLAEQLAGEPVVAVYASRALRTQQTAAPIAALHGLDVEVLPGVHEVFIGELDGRDRPEDHRALHEVYRAWHGGDLARAVPGGETGEQVVERYLADVAKIRANHDGADPGTAVLVSHGAASRLAVVALAANVDGAFGAPRLLSNTGTILLETDGPGWRCLRWQDVELDRPA